MDILPYMVSILALLFGVYQFVRSSHKESDTQMTTVLIKLEHIAEGVSEIKTDIKSVKQDVEELRERMAKVEASSASAHKRLDGVFGSKDHKDTKG